MLVLLLLLAHQRRWPAHWLQVPMRLWLGAQAAWRQPQHLPLLLVVVCEQEQLQALGFSLQVLQQCPAPP
jgi:hypothetical protein